MLGLQPAKYTRVHYPSVAWGWDMKPFIFDELALAGLRFRAKNKYQFGDMIADNYLLRHIMAKEN
ncbi:MAG: hypothetical protein LBN37_05930 [Bacteroidales bacterium]|jgi:hypothetical protein|nr:hypothetical protein [Bacteroidales bacterium]